MCGFVVVRELVDVGVVYLVALVLYDLGSMCDLCWFGWLWCVSWCCMSVWCRYVHGSCWFSPESISALSVVRLGLVLRCYVMSVSSVVS